MLNTADNGSSPPQYHTTMFYSLNRLNVHSSVCVTVDCCGTVWKWKHLRWYITSVHLDSDWLSTMAVSARKQNQKNACHQTWSKNTSLFTDINGYWPTHLGMLCLVKTLPPGQPHCLLGWHPKRCRFINLKLVEFCQPWTHVHAGMFLQQSST